MQKVFGNMVSKGCISGINIAGSPIETPGYVAGDLPDGAGCTASMGGDKMSAEGYTVGTATVTGGTCMEGAGEAPGTVPVGAPPGTTGEPNTAPAPCPVGQAPGTVNGTQICAPMGTDTPTVAPAPDAGTKVETNADGSSTTKTTTGTTECKAGTCTTTTTVTTVTKDASGTVTGTSVTGGSTSQSQSAFCQANGKSPQCAGEGDGEGGSFSGDCVAGFKADGDDAILNAMALEQHKRNCQLLDTTGPEAQEVTAEMEKTGNRTGDEDNPNNSEVNIGSGNFDTSDALGGGSCNLNKTVVVRGYSATLPFNVLCDPLGVLGQVLVAVSLLLAARIVTRG